MMRQRTRIGLYKFVSRLHGAVLLAYVACCGLLVLRLPLGVRFGLSIPKTFDALFALALAVVICSAVRVHLKDSVVPSRPTLETRFRERFASGRLLQSMETRLDTGNKRLEIVVTADELWTRLELPSRWVVSGQASGLENRIPLSSIRSVAGSGLMRRSVTISFHDVAGDTRQLQLSVRRREAFLLALHHGNLSLPVPERRS